MNEEKQKSNYRLQKTDNIVVGRSAHIRAINHPKLGDCTISTGPVKLYDKDTGVFETANTIYTPEQSTGNPFICHKHG